MALPIVPVYPPMEAQLADALPEGEGWQYEPKWDGFRCLAFRDGDDVQLQSKAGQPLARYFPELVAVLEDVPAKRYVLDGEIVIPVGRALSFDALLQRIHPAQSRIKKLAAETPATFVVFDLLVDEKGEDLTGSACGGAVPDWKPSPPGTWRRRRPASRFRPSPRTSRWRSAGCPG